MDLVPSLLVIPSMFKDLWTLLQQRKPVYKTIVSCYVKVGTTTAKQEPFNLQNLGIDNINLIKMTNSMLYPSKREASRLRQLTKRLGRILEGVCLALD